MAEGLRWPRGCDGIRRQRWQGLDDGRRLFARLSPFAAGMPPRNKKGALKKPHSSVIDAYDVARNWKDPIKERTHFANEWAERRCFFRRHQKLIFLRDPF